MKPRFALRFIAFAAWLSAESGNLRPRSRNDAVGVTDFGFVLIVGRKHNPSRRGISQRYSL
jgi:hypothetical protein